MATAEEMKTFVEDLKFKDVPKKEKKSANSSRLTYKIPGLEEIHKQLPGYKEYCEERAKKKAASKEKGDNNVKG